MTDQLFITAKALGGFAGRDEVTQVDPLAVAAALAILFAILLLTRALLVLRGAGKTPRSGAVPAEAGTRV